MTSPPYWGLRDYGEDGQLGLEKTPEEYVEKMVAGFREVRRVLRDDGTLWLNLGDSYNSSSGFSRADEQWAREGRDGGANDKKSIKHPNIKVKDLVGIPWMVAFALRADGWWLRQDIIWHKPNPMPESVTDRCTKSHEYIFLMSKSKQYYYDNEAIKEEAIAPDVKHKSTTKTDEQKSAFLGHAPTNLGRCGTNEDGTRNKRSVWTVTTKPFSGSHFATFPEDLIEPCIKAGCPEGGTVLDPFFGAGTTGVVCEKWGRNCIGIELNETYITEIIKPRIAEEKDKMGLFPE